MKHTQPICGPGQQSHGWLVSGGQPPCFHAEVGDAGRAPAALCLPVTPEELICPKQKRWMHCRGKRACRGWVGGINTWGRGGGFLCEEVIVVPPACFLISVTILPSMHFLPRTERCPRDKLLDPWTFRFYSHPSVMWPMLCLHPPANFDPSGLGSRRRRSHPPCHFKHGRPRWRFSREERLVATCHRPVLRESPGSVNTWACVLRC